MWHAARVLNAKDDSQKAKKWAKGEEVDSLNEGDSMDLRRRARYGRVL